MCGGQVEGIWALSPFWPLPLELHRSRCPETRPRVGSHCLVQELSRFMILSVFKNNDVQEPCKAGATGFSSGKKSSPSCEEPRNPRLPLSLALLGVLYLTWGLLRCALLRHKVGSVL